MINSIRFLYIPAVLRLACLPFRLTLTALLMIFSIAPAVALDADEIRGKLLESIPELSIIRMTPGQIDGFFEVYIEGGSILYVDDEGEHFFLGELYQLQPGSFSNLSGTGWAKVRKGLLAEIDESGMIVFSPAPEQVRTTITVFTDIDCTYCRRLHQKIPEYNALGIAIKYMAYPRTGVGSPSWDKAVSTWCADDPRATLTEAKSNGVIQPQTCTNPVMAHYQLGQKIGVTGTPAMVFEDGTLLAGYLPPAELAQRLGLK